MFLDFTEIPPSNKADGHQDEFEFFARDFLDIRGYRALTDQERGLIEFVGQLLPTGKSSDISEMALEFDTIMPETEALLNEPDFCEQYYALVYLSEDVRCTLLGHEIQLGGVLTYAIPTQFTFESVESARALLKQEKSGVTLRARPTEKGHITRYLVNRMTEDDLQQLRSTFPGEAVARVVALRSGNGKKNGRH